MQYGLHDLERSQRKVEHYSPYDNSAGRIPGAERKGTVWIIPKDAEKPIDGRRKKPQIEK